MYSLEKLFLFEGLPQEETAAAISELEDKTAFAKGEDIYGFSEYNKALAVLVKGRAEAVSDGVVKAEFSEGAVFGAASLFSGGGDYVSEIIAKSACEVVFIPEDTLKEIITDHPQCGINYIKFLTDKIRYLNTRISEFTGTGVSGRLYRHLCGKADADGYVAENNMAALAKSMDMGRTSLYRAFAELEEKGLVTRDRKGIKIRKEKEL